MGLPVSAEPIQGRAKNPGAQIGCRTARQHQEAAIVGDEAQSATPLLVGPLDPLIASAQMAGGGTKHQNRQPPACGIRGHAVEAFAHRFEAAQVVMLVQEAVQAGQLPTLGQSLLRRSPLPPPLDKKLKWFWCFLAISGENWCMGEAGAWATGQTGDREPPGHYDPCARVRQWRSCCLAFRTAYTTMMSPSMR